MATDIARLSFDPARHYTGVAAQQGRVTLEAEQNEQRIIDAEERRLELIDIIGPAGTPDNGYAITVPTGSDFTIGAGTMYVGGLRVALDHDILYSKQPDWLDHADDPDWIAPDGKAGLHEHIVLVVQERDVTAVEDPVLREAALGGPDGSARTVLLQHVEQKPTEVGDCFKALPEAEHAWASQGLIFDEATLQLRSESRLLVTWEGIAEPPDPCEPASTGGYLGAENQLIRVQVTAVDTVKGTFDLVWGWDNASFLYRVTADASTNPVLTLDRSPADDYHRPRAGQAVQVLRAAADLRSIDAVVEGYVAALHGQVAVLTAPYDPDTKTVQFPAALLASSTDPKQTAQLYLRVWEEQLTGNTTGTPITLTGTGVQVTISLDGPGPVHVDDYWCIGVRPSTSTEVYPERYLRTPQPPDGPRQWACPLAVITWLSDQRAVIKDCRHHFRPLPDSSVITQASTGAGPQFRAVSSGWCSIDVGPSDVRDGRLQQLIDAAVADRPGDDDSSRVTICLQPGRYELQEPIALRQQHSNLTVCGRSEAAVISAAPGFELAFGQGLIVLVGADNVTITGLQLELPQTPAALATVRASQQQDKAFAAALNAIAANRHVSIGIRPVHCAVLTISDCLFRFTLGAQVTTPEAAPAPPGTMFGVGVFAASDCAGLHLERNRFLYDSAPRPDVEGSQHALAGYLLTPAAVAPAGGKNAFRQFNGSQIGALLDDAVIRDNTFDGISVGVVVLAELGTIRIWDNIIRRSYAGIWLTDTTAAALTDLGGTFSVPSGLKDQAGAVRAAVAAGLLDPVLLLLTVFGRTFPLPDLGTLELATSAVDAADREKLQAAGEQARQEWMTRFVNDVATGLTPARPRRRGTAKTAAGASTEATTADFNQGIGSEAALIAQASPIQQQLLAANAGLAALTRLVDSAAQAELMLRIERNDVECGLEEPTTSGPAAFVDASLREGSTTSAEVTANRISSTGTAAAAALLGLTSQAITGNIVTAKATSLVVAASPHVAITGNVITGTPILPANRPLPPPLDRWLPLNTIV